MNRFHVLGASIILGLAAIFGVAATTKTAGFGAATRTVDKVSNKTISARRRKLNRAEVAIRRARADRPPALPAVPKVSATAPQAQKVIYQRPAPIVVVRHRSSHGDDHGAEQEGSDD